MWEIVEGFKNFIINLPKKTICLVAISCFAHYYQFTTFGVIMDDFNSSTNLNISEPRLASIMFIIATTILGCDYWWFNVMPKTSLSWWLPIQIAFYITMQNLLTLLTEIYLWAPFYIGVYGLRDILVDWMLEYGDEELIDAQYWFSETVHNYFLVAISSFYLVVVLRRNEPFRFILRSLKKALIWETNEEGEEGHSIAVVHRSRSRKRNRRAGRRHF